MSEEPKRITWTTEKRRINDLIPYEFNPRTLSKEAATQLEKSLKKFDLAEIPVINTDNKIIAGHQRLFILTRLGRGEEEIDVRVPSRTLDEKEFQEYNIRSNKNSGEWDFESLANHFDEKDLVEWGFSEAELGFPPDVDQDEVPELAEEDYVTNPGDMYELGDHILFCGDSTSEDDVSRLLNGKNADMVFTDPPYNVDYSGGVVAKEDRRIKNDKMSADDFQMFIDAVVKNLLDFCNGAIYCCMSSSEWGTLQSSFINQGGHWSRVIVWVKDRLVLSRGDYHTQFEPIALVNENKEEEPFQEEAELMLYGWKEGNRHKFNGGRKQADVWKFDRPTSSKEHPTMKPVDLVGRAVKNGSDMGDVVLDLFGGSGTTLIVCEQLGRKCRMMELDPKYCDVIVRRWENLTGRKAKKLNP